MKITIVINDLFNLNNACHAIAAYFSVTIT